MKKVLSLVLVLTLVLCTSTVALVASAYTEKTKIVVQALDAEGNEVTNVKVGDTFTLKFTMPELMGDLGGLAMYYVYNADAVSLDYSTMVCEGFPSGWTNEGAVDEEGYDLPGGADYKVGYICYQLMDASAVTNFTEDFTSTAYVSMTCTALADGDFNFQVLVDEDAGNVPDVNDWEWSFQYDPETQLDFVLPSVKVGGETPVDPVDPDPVPDPTVWQVTLVYADGSEETIDVEEGKTIPAEKLVLNPSAEYVYSWDGDVTAPITSEATFKVVKSERTYAVDVNGEVKNMTYKSGLVVTADEEKDGQAFAYWTKDGQVVSYDRTYKLLVYADSKIEAVYAESVSAQASAFIDTPYYTMSGKNLKMVSSLQVVLPAGVSVDSFKIYRAVRTDGEALDADALIAKNSVANAGSNKFNAQGRLDYSILSSVDSVKYTDIVFVATLSDGSSVTSNVVTVGAQLA